MAPRDQFRYSSLSLRRGPERNERRRSGPGSEGVDDFRIGWACGCHLRPSLQYRVDEVLLKREPYHANAVRPRLQHVDPWDVRGRDRHLREDQFHGNPGNPELRVAIASLRQSDQEVKVAWTAMLPSLGLDYFYGIDANQFATHDRQGFRNLGYAASATLQLPIWNWGASYSKVKQADLRRQQAHIELSFAQRRLLADLRSFYDEAETARAQLESLSQTAELASESLRLTTLRYQAGEATVLEVVDAQNTLTLARNAYDDGQVRFQVALANLQTLTGSF